MWPFCYHHTFNGQNSGIIDILKTNSSGKLPYNIYPRFIFIEDAAGNWSNTNADVWKVNNIIRTVCKISSKLWH